MTDPLAGSPWSTPETVAGFVASPPNATLMRFAAAEHSRRPRHRALDIGCGAGRNAVPLAAAGWQVVGLDLSLPMLHAAHKRRDSELAQRERLRLALAPMHHLPVEDCSCDLVIAHGIWNLARSGTEFRQALREAARVAAGNAALFVFTFSRHTLPADVQPAVGETFVFTQFSGQPQCFLTREQLVAELDAAGFIGDDGVALRELNRPAPGSLTAHRAPVIWEGAFRRRRD